MGVNCINLSFFFLFQGPLTEVEVYDDGSKEARRFVWGDDVKVWAKDLGMVLPIFKPERRDKSDYILEFASETDMMLFKLRWL